MAYESHKQAVRKISKLEKNRKFVENTSPCFSWKIFCQNKPPRKSQAQKSPG
jgi:hypothetical protein